jgi:hypothetical protein
MTNHKANSDLPEAQRQEIFQALVEAQDQGQSPTQSRRTIAERFGISDRQLRDIEREGIDRQWPPL